MCGIVGYVGNQAASTILLDGLKRLEYRGYDSSGIAVMDGLNLTIERAEGKLVNLTDKLKSRLAKGTTGIGHTRWATHGRPCEENAHPHRAGRVVLVHNGIIENYETLKSQLPKKGRELLSETDTEIICHLINKELTRGAKFEVALARTLKKLEGTYALVILDTENPGVIHLAKKGSPMVIGVGRQENFIASDVPALLPYTRDVIYLEDSEQAVVSATEIKIRDVKGAEVRRARRRIEWSAEQAEKEGYKHFMLKEIMEQPRAIADTLSGRVQVDAGEMELREISKLFASKKFPSFDRFYIVACGTSWHAAMAGKYMMEAIAKLSVNVDTASEFRYREPFIDKKTLLLVISQSGETADTLACVKEARKQGAKVISICNVMDASIPRASHATLYTQAGPEIGVASTKAFTTQLLVLLMLSLYFGRKNGVLDKKYVNKAFRQLRQLPKVMTEVLKQGAAIIDVAREYHGEKDFYFIARGVHYPIALEGALKLKEISYIHAEGYSAGEMKHGPIALIEPGTPVVALAPKDRVCEKMISNIQEVRARGARMIVIATAGDKRFEKHSDHVIYLPKTEWYITPLLATLPLQLLAYHIADQKGADVDQPRNLAKSVTVE